MDRTTKILIAIILGAGIIVFLALMLKLFGTDTPMPSGEEEDSFPWIVFLPVFVGAMVPIYARRSKKLSLEASDSQKRFVAIAVILLLVVLGLAVAFLLLS